MRQPRRTETPHGWAGRSARGHKRFRRPAHLFDGMDPDKEGRVEPEAIAAQEQIAFRYASFPEEFDGILLHEDGRFFIVCNESRAERGSPRSRFTLAHELGHYFLAEHREALASGRMPPHFSLAEHASNIR